MFTQISKKTIGVVGSTVLISSFSMNAQASDINTDIVLSLEKTMAQQTAKLIEVAKQEVMLSFEAQLAEMMLEFSISEDATEKSTNVQVAKSEQIEDQKDSDIE